MTKTIVGTIIAVLFLGALLSGYSMLQKEKNIAVAWQIAANYHANKHNYNEVTEYEQLITCARDIEKCR